MKPLIHFKHLKYDTRKLKSCLDLLDDDSWSAHFSDYSAGWMNTPLISFKGGMDANSNREHTEMIAKALKRKNHRLHNHNLFRLETLAKYYRKTILLKKMDYINEIIDSFRCSKLRVRLMKMNPRVVVPEHSDTQGWRRGIARLHLPIVTNDKVHFVVNGEKALMKEGELWYTDVTCPHSVRNDSEVVRVHLVIDLVVNKWLREFFPRENSKEQLINYWIRKRKNIFYLKKQLGIPPTGII